MLVIAFAVGVVVGNGIEQGRTIAGPLIRANDELAQEFIAERVEVQPIVLSVLAILQIALCSSSVSDSLILAKQMCTL